MRKLAIIFFDAAIMMIFMFVCAAMVMAIAFYGWEFLKFMWDWLDNCGRFWESFKDYPFQCYRDVPEMR